MMHPLPSVSQAFRLIIQEENHKEFSNSAQQPDAMAFSVARKFYPKNHGDSAISSQNFNKKKPGANYYCTNCKISGHSIDRCFKIHGFPAGFKPNRNKRVVALS